MSVKSNPQKLPKTQKTVANFQRQSANSSKPRLAWIDLLETLAIFAVVFYHSTSFIANNDFSAATSSHFYIFYFFRSILTVCVPIFFFANGFLLFRKPADRFNLKTHLLKTLKFFLLALVWYIITLAFLLFLHRDEIRLDNPLAALSTVKSGVNHLWYLGALVCIYLFYPLLKITYDRYRPAFIYFTLLCLILTFGNSILNTLCTIFSYFILHNHQIFIDTNFLSIFNPLRGLYAFSFAYFCLGGLVAAYLPRLLAISKQKRNLISTVALILSWIILFALGLLYSSISGNIWDNVWFGYDSIFTLVAILAIFFLCQNYTSKNRLISTISQNTLGIYLIHTLLIAAVATLYPLKILTNFSSPLLLLTNLLFAGAILIVSLLLSLLLRRLPLLRNLVS